MYCEFYQMSERPFNVTPDPKFLYLNARYREAIASLNYGITRCFLKEPLKLVLRHFNPSEITVVADAKLAKTQFLHECLACGDSF